MSAVETVLDPLVSEFETQEQADSYDQWLRTKVAATLANTRPTIPHDEAMARIDHFIVSLDSREVAA